MAMLVGFLSLISIEASAQDSKNSGSSAQSGGQIPSFPVPGTNGSVVIGPTPPPGNPGQVVTITPGKMPDGSFGAGATVTIPIEKCKSCHVTNEASPRPHGECASIAIVLPQPEQKSFNPCEATLVMPDAD